jgi:hypothetical protein
MSVIVLRHVLTRTCDVVVTSPIAPLSKFYAEIPRVICSPSFHPSTPRPLIFALLSLKR